MRAWTAFVSSSIGMKIVMAVSGGLLILFLIGHMVGNLEFFAGAEALNGYAALLRAWPPFLWIARSGLLVLALVHILSSVRLTVLNRAARPQGYRRREGRTATLAGRTMLLSGIVVVWFVVFHVLHFTVRSVEPEYRHWEDALGRHDVHRMVQDAFQRPSMAVVYAVSMVLVGLHVSHGIASMLHTLGLHHPRYGGAWRRLGPVFALLLFLGFVAVPLSVLLGFAAGGP